MDRRTVKEIALKHGFSLKPQADGTKDLNPYVYEFAEALLKAGKPTAKGQATTELIAESKALMAALRGPELATALPIMERLQGAIDEAEKAV